MKVIFDEKPADTIPFSKVDPKEHLIVGTFTDVTNSYSDKNRVFTVDFDGRIYDITSALDVTDDDYHSFFSDSTYEISEVFAFEDMNEYLQKLVDLIDDYLFLQSANEDN